MRSISQNYGILTEKLRWFCNVCGNRYFVSDPSIRFVCFSWSFWSFMSWISCVSAVVLNKCHIQIPNWINQVKPRKQFLISFDKDKIQNVYSDIRVHILKSCNKSDSNWVTERKFHDILFQKSVGIVQIARDLFTDIKIPCRKLNMVKCRNNKKNKSYCFSLNETQTLL